MYLRTLPEEILLAWWTRAKIFSTSCRPTTLFFLRLGSHSLVPQVVFGIYDEGVLIRFPIIYCVESIQWIKINGLMKRVFVPLVESLLVYLHLLGPNSIFHPS